MNEVVEYGGAQNGFGRRRLQTIDHDVQFRPVYEPNYAESVRPITIQLNVGRDQDGAKDKGRGVSFLRSKLVWLLLTLMVSAGATYARTQTICQGFKDSGKFYYGMDVNRCVNILIKQPLATVEQHLGKINGGY